MPHEQPGQVVTRDQLHKKLWCDGTVVDSEHGLNAAIQRLRQALGDSAENPRFVETLARRGYRFLAPVDVARNEAAANDGNRDQRRASKSSPEPYRPLRSQVIEEYAFVLRGSTCCAV